MMEMIIRGSDCRGKWYPYFRLSTDKTVDDIIKTYQATYPLICHVSIELALPMTEINR